MELFNVEIESITPLLQHRMPEEELFKLLGTKEKLKQPKQNLTPRQIAEKHVYTSNGNYVLPLEYIRGSFIKASSDYKNVSSSKKSLKSVAGGAFRPLGEYAQLLNKSNEKVELFEVDIRKATNHTRGAVAVCRPRFDYWKARFMIELNTDIISAETALNILQDAGKRVGIGSFRVERGGYFGQFQITQWQKN